MTRPSRPTRDFFVDQALTVAPKLLGAVVSVASAEGTVRVRITEVEAYHGVGTTGPYDPGSHARTRRTDRNASMFGPPGHAYVYFTYGMHHALNLVCSPDGIASGVLLRAGLVVDGEDLARARRAATRNAASPDRPLPHHALARGPGNLAASLGLTRETHDGLDLFTLPFDLELPDSAPGPIASGPRVGVSGQGGSHAFPWRFWISGDRTVSAYRPGKNVPGKTQL